MNERLHKIADDEYVTAAPRGDVTATTPVGNVDLLPVYQLHYAVFYNASTPTTTDSQTNNFTDVLSTVVPDVGGGRIGGPPNSRNPRNQLPKALNVEILASRLW